MISDIRGLVARRLKEMDLLPRIHIMADLSRNIANSRNGGLPTGQTIWPAGD